MSIRSFTEEELKSIYTLTGKYVSYDTSLNVLKVKSGINVRYPKGVPSKSIDVPMSTVGESCYR